MSKKQKLSQGIPPFEVMRARPEEVVEYKFEKEGYENNSKLNKQLAALFNEHGVDAECNVPDFVLAAYVLRSLVVLRLVMNDRYKHFGVDHRGVTETTEPEPLQQPTRQDELLAMAYCGATIGVIVGSIGMMYLGFRPTMCVVGIFGVLMFHKMYTTWGD